MSDIIRILVGASNLGFYRGKHSLPAVGAALSWSSFRGKGAAPVATPNPQMTSNSQNGYVVTTNCGGNPYLAFNKGGTSLADTWDSGVTVGNAGGFAQYNCQLNLQYPMQVKLQSYYLRGYFGWSPKDWTIQGSNDGINYTFIDTQVGQDPSNGLTYTVNSTTYYSYLRIKVTMVTAHSGYNVNINELIYYTTT